MPFNLDRAFHRKIRQTVPKVYTEEQDQRPNNSQGNLENEQCWEVYPTMYQDILYKDRQTNGMGWSAQK